MSVTTVKEGLRVEQVYDDSPAKEGGLKAGDIIVSVNGKLARGQDVGRVDGADQGAGGQHGEARRAPGQRASSSSRSSARRSTSRSSRAEIERYRRQEDRLGLGSPASRPARARTSRTRSARSCATGPRAIVFDLRHNGGGLLNEAVEVASVFIPDGRDRLDQGPRAAGARLQRRRAARSRARSRWSCSSTRARRRRRRSSPARCRTASGRRWSARARTARASSRRSSACANGGALDITVGEYFTPSGRNLGGGGVRKGAGITPDITASDDPKTEPRRGAAEGAGDAVAG